MNVLFVEPILPSSKFWDRCRSAFLQLLLSYLVCELLKMCFYIICILESKGGEEHRKRWGESSFLHFGWQRSPGFGPDRSIGWCEVPLRGPGHEKQAWVLIRGPDQGKLNWLDLVAPPHLVLEWSYIRKYQQLSSSGKFPDETPAH